MQLAIFPIHFRRKNNSQTFFLETFLSARRECLSLQINFNAESSDVICTAQNQILISFFDFYAVLCNFWSTRIDELLQKSHHHVQICADYQYP